MDSTPAISQRVVYLSGVAVLEQWNLGSRCGVGHCGTCRAGEHGVPLSISHDLSSIRRVHKSQVSELCTKYPGKRPPTVCLESKGLRSRDLDIWLQRGVMVVVVVFDKQGLKLKVSSKSRGGERCLEF